MANIIFDFDHTLFDSKTFKDHIDLLIKEGGVSQDIAGQAECEFRSNNFNNYDFESHIEEIKRRGSDIHPSVYNKFAKLDFKKYIKGNVHEVIKRLQNKGHRTILLTKGIESFQETKLVRSEIKELFGTDIIICPTGKEGILERMGLDQPSTYFFNDDIPETNIIKEVLPHVTYIICKRGDDKFDYTDIDPSFHLISSVDELEDIIK